MKLEKGQYVECLLKNGWIVAGIVEELSSSGLELIRSDKQGITIIMRPDEEISVIKIFYLQPSDEPKQEAKVPSKYKPIVEAMKSYDPYEMPHEDPSKIKTLVDLRKEMLKQEKEEIANKLKSHTVGEVKEVKYGYPRLFTKQSTK
jgi:hypothetical protein